MKVLQIGPGIHDSKGGMATVIGEIQADPNLRERFELESFSSYADGGKLRALTFSLLAFLRFIFSGRAKSFDVYHIHVASYTSTWRKAMYARLLKAHHKKIILHIHGGKYMEFYQGLSAPMKRRVTNFLQSADLVIALSDVWKEKFITTFQLQNCVVLGNGVDMEKLAPAITAPEVGQNGFLALSRMTETKGTYDLLNAVEIAKNENPEIKLYLAGDGEIEKVRQIVTQKNMQDTVQVIGWADFKKKLELLGKVSTVVLPSYAEALPMCILEGMGCGKAIISTEVGAIPETVAPENGILIRPGDVDALASAMVSLSKEPARLAICAAENLRKVEEKFSLREMHRTLASFYEKI